MSPQEKSYWQDRAALLDPKSYELVFGSNWTRIVPTNETWYSLSQYNTNSTGQESIHQRLGDIDQAILIPSGTVFSPSQYASLYVSKPSSVKGVDSRYWDDPRGLFYSRLNRLRSLPLNFLSLALPASMAVRETATADFPDDFESGLLVGVSVTEISWGGLSYLENGEPTGSVNLQNEINNDHSIRFAQGLKFPFLRSVFPGIMAAAGNHAGEYAAASVGGGFVVTYVKLPSDW